MITLHCNDELRQTADTKDLIYDCGRLIEFASSFYTLYPGDVYFTGTPHGVGPVKAGDTLRGKNDVLGELEITRAPAQDRRVMRSELRHAQHTER